MRLKPISELFSNSEEIQEFFSLAENEKISIEGITPNSFSLIIGTVYNHSPGQIIVLTNNSHKMQEIFKDISCFVDSDNIFTLPPWEVLPYESVSPSESIERDRITALYKLINNDPVIIVTTVESLIRKIPAKEFMLKKGIIIKTEEEYPFDVILEQLVDFGYTREYRVESFGQFSVKGGIIDIFLPTHQNPIRLDFFGDTLEAIREFDIVSQTSISKIDHITIYPRRELILSQNEIELLLDSIKDDKMKDLLITEILENSIDEMKGVLPKINGIEDMFPLVINSVSLLSYFKDDARIFTIEKDELITQKEMLENTFQELYIRKSPTIALPPDELIQPDILNKVLSRSIDLQVFSTTQNALQWKLQGIPNFLGKIKRVREEIKIRLDDGWMIIICTSFEGQARRLFDLLGEFQPGSNFYDISLSEPLNILITPLEGGFEILSRKILVITDNEIFGKKYRKRKQFKKKESRPIDSFLDLEVGDYVVHINHGIGIFKGIERMSAGGVERDFLAISYMNEDKLYVALDQITMVQRYIGIDSKKPRLDSLGKKSAWNRVKEKVQQSVEDTAKELIEIYSKRQALVGRQFPPDTLWQEEFESKFEFEETPDQLTAIEDVKDDMESSQPMDRLICGDVGFGKTEVAIRASFKAVMAGAQVAILVPTTVLAMQHFTTFQTRFTDYPINIEMISRFRTQTDINRILQQLADGKIDIIIGTHALLSEKITFKNLGLLIIDEEQRFGVKHKEKIKKIRLLVDVLTLSATPIPRTLHMAIAGIRDLSTITTPPENRQSIDTYVLEDNPDVIRMAILQEIKRGYQVFFVYNRVQSIDMRTAALKDLVPEASFCVAHGQMKVHELEDVMIDFLNCKYDVLVSTSIIESGLDMPNVNTIIIDRADTFGLSQLYQLKGRVGRSFTKAYAYLFYPRHIPLKETAQKRLQVISEHSDLGSGFKIAMKDLEIRGSGNILGKEQSGNIMDVGFDLYCQMLEDAVKKLKGEKVEGIFRTPVFLKTNFYIPKSYIDDERQKIEFYKRFESCEFLQEVDELENELIDRFGAPHENVKILIELEKIRAIASSLRIDEILEDSKAVNIKISKNTNIDTQKIIKLLKKDERLSLCSNNKDILIFNPGEKAEEKKLMELKKLLQQIS
ncbi:MAG: transcription-repair coupling factor [Spirochaetota bacterium]|nr:transcription-repair coupling factor [Spirochaetota bacterium]